MKLFKEKPNTIIVHCSASNIIADANSIRDLHINSFGWSDIGYHFVIDRKATIQMGRSIRHQGAHCRGHNDYSIGICLGGNTHMDFSRRQFESLQSVCSQLRRHNPEIKYLMAHYELDTKGKTCPNVPAELLRLWLGFEKRPDSQSQ